MSNDNKIVDWLNEEDLPTLQEETERKSYEVKIVGWISVISLTFLNLKGLPDSILGFFGQNPTVSETHMANTIAAILIVAILALLIWIIVDFTRANRNIAKESKQNG